MSEQSDNRDLGPTDDELKEDCSHIIETKEMMEGLFETAERLFGTNASVIPGGPPVGLLVEIARAALKYRDPADEEQRAADARVLDCLLSEFKKYE